MMKTIICILCFLVAGISSLPAQNKKALELDVNIRLFRDSFDHNEAIVIRMDLTNNSQNDQRIYIDTADVNAAECISISLVDTMTKKSVTRYPKRPSTSSTLYSSAKWNNMLYILKPKDLFRNWFTIRDITEFNNENGVLGKGTYELQVTYCYNASNKVIFSVR